MLINGSDIIGQLIIYVLNIYFLILSSYSEPTIIMDTLLKYYIVIITAYFNDIFE